MDFVIEGTQFSVINHSARKAQVRRDITSDIMGFCKLHRLYLTAKLSELSLSGLVKLYGKLIETVEAENKLLDDVSHSLQQLKVRASVLGTFSETEADANTVVTAYERNVNKGKQVEQIVTSSGSSACDVVIAAGNKCCYSFGTIAEELGRQGVVLRDPDVYCWLALYEPCTWRQLLNKPGKLTVKQFKTIKGVKLNKKDRFRLDFVTNGNGLILHVACDKNGGTANEVVTKLLELPENSSVIV